MQFMSHATRLAALIGLQFILATRVPSYGGLQYPGAPEDERLSLVYEPATGSLSIDLPNQLALTSIYIKSEHGQFLAQNARPPALDGAFDIYSPNEIFHLPTSGSPFFAELSLDRVLPPNRDGADLASDLSAYGSCVASECHFVDLYIVPE